jgi:hypothetical protein
MSANLLEDQFESAANWLSTSPSVANLSNDEKLEVGASLFLVAMTVQSLTTLAIPALPLDRYTASTRWPRMDHNRE